VSKARPESKRLYDLRVYYADRRRALAEEIAQDLALERRLQQRLAFLQPNLPIRHPLSQEEVPPPSQQQQQPANPQLQPHIQRLSAYYTYHDPTDIELEQLLQELEQDEAAAQGQPPVLPVPRRDATQVVPTDQAQDVRVPPPPDQLDVDDAEGPPDHPDDDNNDDNNNNNTNGQDDNNRRTQLDIEAAQRELMERVRQQSIISGFVSSFFL
jgi:hypothetical protein